MLLPALRRFTLLLAVISVGTALCSAALGLLLGSSVSVSIAIGFYLIGCFLLLGGFFFGNLGPVRPRSQEDAGGDIFSLFQIRSRRLRWATREEQEEAINTSAVFLPLGLVLILLGVVSDSRHSLF
ncbi:MAG TPA: hypothetical protein VK488_14955 [Gaiellaceae bacterium]|nr:hypothetical protein [Gaiellaceae bacterium]